MYSLPLALILIPYAIILLVFSVFSVVNILHLVHYGTATSASFLITFGFLSLTAIILFTTWQMTAGTDWFQPMVMSLPTFDNSLFPLQ